MTNRPLLATFTLLAMAAPLVAQEVPPPGGADGAAEILARYADAWRGGEEFALDSALTLGFRIGGPGGGEYHVVLGPEGPGRLGEGIPEGRLVFETEIDFLRRLDRGEMHVLTAMAQARGGDRTPLVPRFPPGFRWTAESRAFWFPLLASFWNREWPEVVRFGDGLTREVHGANAAVIHYDVGFRSAWYQLLPGMHINPDPRDQTNPYPSLVIVMRGEAHARIGGVDVVLREGEALHIRPGVTHEFWVGDGGYAEAIVVMYGEGA
jgi:mannose-6-phosphate isomerase-like protein (cupin superfamily)